MKKIQERYIAVRLGWAVSTVDKNHASLSGELAVAPIFVFSHGQLYVAWSHVRSFASVKVLLPARRVKTKYVVYREVLL